MKSFRMRSLRRGLEKIPLLVLLAVVFLSALPAAWAAKYGLPVPHSADAPDAPDAASLEAAPAGDADGDTGDASAGEPQQLPVEVDGADEAAQ